MERSLLIAGGILGMLSVIIGAFGAHALKAALDTEALKSFETGVKYQMYHALFLMLVAQVQLLTPGAKQWIFYLVIIGVLLFSGSIYLLTTTPVTGINIKKFGFITPIGGTMLIVAWGVFLFQLFTGKK
ncbi:DUF423 domain-containing protein [Robertkochia aurantiaca]|uniref:DUF423 domain-containing protein n=1 Tax=Robertkochia aurantiaca TaxID=2873700 RepID=UPI001CCE1A35|nr:DUF423 domain-containing protein [Robertkochia sp. 3YJGBD-33]